MAKFYITLGSDRGGGWCEVTAEDEDMARRIYGMYHPPVNGLLPFCSSYSEEEFRATKMYREGNFGKRCVESIVLNRFTYMGVGF